MRGAARDLTVRAIAERIVYIEARLLGQVHAPGRDERQAAFVERFFRAREREHDAKR